VPTSQTKALYEVAVKQAGHFTTQQAKTAGFQESTHPYHVRRNNWIRVHRGLYRLAVFPQSRLGELIGWRLWSRDRKQIPQGVFSHLTALELHRLFLPTEMGIFMTVPTSFRRTSKTPAALVLYKASLQAQEVVEAEGIPITGLRRTLKDIAESKLLPTAQFTSVLERVAALGLVDAQFLNGLKGDQFELRFHK
jgi:predicted transcriptional regulator of viral defense system